jgi:hypothetical protein
MGAIKFSAHIGPNRTLTLPDEVADQLQEDQAVEVIILVPDAEEDEDREWARFSAQQLFRSYADEDSVYDDLDLSAR